jgi:ribonucleotide monophosphatase NagD (HAD superfamily)
MNREGALPFKCSAVVSDVDGTIVTDDKILTPRAQAAVEELRTSGIVFRSPAPGHRVACAC